MIFIGGVTSVTGVVMEPLATNFGWTRALVTANIMICSVMSLLLAPVVGYAIGRFGVRRCAMTGAIAAIPGVLAIALNPGNAAWWIVSWVFFGAIITLLSPLVWSTAVTEFFDKSRGMALAITLSGAGLAFAFFPPLALAIIQELGWRAVYLIFAALFAFVLLPVLWAWFHGGQPRRNAQTDSAQASLEPNVSSSSPAIGSPFARALRRRQFWQLAIVCVIVAGVEGAMAIHLYPILNEGGLSPMSAAAATSTMGAALIVGRLGTGFLQDHFPARHVFMLAIAAILGSCLLTLVNEGSPLMGVLIAVLLGLGSGGTINSLAYICGRYFSLLAYASIFGLIAGLFAVGYGVAPMIAAHARDVAGGYDLIIPVFTGLILASMAVAAFLGREPDVVEA